MGRLSEESIASYAQEGYLVLRRVFSEGEMQAVSAEATALLTRRELIHTNNLRCRFKPHDGGGPYLFETFDPVVDIAPRMAALAADRRITGALAAIYGEEACLFKDKLIYKPPGAVGYGLHQDYVALPHYPRSAVTALVTIDPADVENGCLEVFGGYHGSGSLTAEDGRYRGLEPGVVDEARAAPLALEPGDAVFFSCFAPHRSGPNRSNRWRRSLYLTYNAARDGDQRETFYREYQATRFKQHAAAGNPEVFYR
jgi:ectoine hydroxylase-related dioxygenase (phytanoyl-CoA dioxygenase family)